MSKGLYSTSELIDSLIVDCNNAVKSCINGQYIQFCNTMVQMVQKLANLKTGVSNEMKNRDETIEMLKRNIRELGGKCEDIPIEEFVNEAEGSVANGKD